MPWLFINEKVINRSLFLGWRSTKNLFAHSIFTADTFNLIYCLGFILVLLPPASLSLSVSLPKWKRLDESFWNSCQCTGHAYFPSFMSPMKCRIFNLVFLETTDTVCERKAKIIKIPGKGCSKYSNYGYNGNDNKMVHSLWLLLL